MAITATLITDGASNTGATSYTTASVSPASNRLLFLFAHVSFLSAHSSGSWPSFTASGLGLTWTEHARQLHVPDGSNFWAALYLFRAVGTVTPGTITLSAGQNVDTITWHLIELSDADTSGTNGANGVVQTVQASRSEYTTSTSITLAAFASENNALLAAFGCDYNFTPVAGAGLTELSDRTSTWASTGVYFRNSPQTSVGITHNNNLSKAAIGIEIKAAGGTASVVPVLMQHYASRRQ